MAGLAPVGCGAGGGEGWLGGEEEFAGTIARTPQHELATGWRPSRVSESCARAIDRAGRD